MYLIIYYFPKSLSLNIMCVNLNVMYAIKYDLEKKS